MQAQATQDAHRAASNKMPPLWALLMILVLGANEFMTFLFNPVYLVLVLIVGVFGTVVYRVRALASSPGSLHTSSQLGSVYWAAGACCERDNCGCTRAVIS